MLREVYINLLDAKEPKFDLSNNIEAHRLSQVKDYSKTIVKISEDEIKKHKEFLKSELRKNFIELFSFYIISQNRQTHLFSHL